MWAFAISLIDRIYISRMASRDAFFEVISRIPRSTQSELQTSQDIDEKINILTRGKPIQGKDYSKWYRLNKKYTLIECQTSRILYLRGNDDVPNKRVVAIEDIYEILKKLHVRSKSLWSNWAIQTSINGVSWNSSLPMPNLCQSLRNMSA